MRKFLMMTTAALLLSHAAMACECADVDGAKLLADPALSIADVTVGGMNMANHQSALTINTTQHGELTAQHIRAKFGSDECATVPQWKQNMTLLIKAEDDATYSIAGQCETQAAISALKNNNPQGSK